MVKQLKGLPIESYLLVMYTLRYFVWHVTTTSFFSVGDFFKCYCRGFHRVFVFKCTLDNLFLYATTVLSMNVNNTHLLSRIRFSFVKMEFICVMCRLRSFIWYATILPTKNFHYLHLLTQPFMYKILGFKLWYLKFAHLHLLNDLLHEPFNGVEKK